MAYYSEDLVDEVISRADIVEVINTYVPLKKRGANFLGLCPFHKEKTPSFTVSQDKQIYKCFGCGAGGNVISFVSKIENLDFKDTLEHLADKTNIDLASYEVKNNNFQGPSNKDLKDRVFEINLETAKYFHEALVEEIKDPKSNLTQYLKKRKIDGAVITKFGLGYGNKKDISLYTHLTNKGFDKKEILASGVVTQNIKGNIYENFAGRLIFPILDIRDRVIAFGGRVLDNSLPKYVNSPENIVYIKGKNLYGLNVAKRETLSRVIIVEGYMDTVALQKNNVTNVVASLGTALTENQAKLLKKYTDTVIIGYDQDNAGKAATLRAIDILYKEGLKVKVLCLDKDDVKDPDEYINKYGTERFLECVKNSKAHPVYKVERLEEKLDNTDFDSKVEFLTGVAKVLSSIENDIERDMYIDVMSSKYKINRDVILSEVNKKLNKVSNINKTVDTTNFVKRKIVTSSLRRKQEEYILALLLSNDKKISNEIINSFKEKDIESEDLKDLFSKIFEIAKEVDISKINITTKFTKEKDVELISQILCTDISTFDKPKLIEDLKNSFKKYRYMDRRQEILEELNKDMDPDEKRLLELELGQIIIKLSKLK